MGVGVGMMGTQGLEESTEEGITSNFESKCRLSVSSSKLASLSWKSNISEKLAYSHLRRGVWGQEVALPIVLKVNMRQKERRARSIQKCIFFRG